MIDLNCISRDDAGCYVAAFNRCKKIINENELSHEEAISAVVAQLGFAVENVDMLRQYLFEQISLPIEPIVAMYGEEAKRSTWWNDFQKSAPNLTPYWSRYERYLSESKGWDLQVIDRSIDTPTNSIMNAISNPRIQTPCERIGMVFGYVQSGKTANYIGLLNKAIDSGYKIIIVLTGMHNNLRSQTQSRIDEEVLGYETSIELLLAEYTRKPNAIGVGKDRNIPPILIPTLTSRDDNGDFNKKRVGTSVQPPIMLITKKNASVLKNIISYFETHPIAKTSEGKRKFINADYPLLLIDDEADQASINTNDCYNEDGTFNEDCDPTKINGYIRKLFNLFKCRSYVGYTATPYANIFIPSISMTKNYGNDLFPRDFIIKIPKSAKYVGAIEFFGLKGDDNVQAMPLSRNIKKGATYLPAGTKKDDPVGELPDELKTAILSFVISTAYRNCRGQRNKPNTMLIHILRFVNTQKKLKKRVSDFYADIRAKIKYGDQDIFKELEQLWKEDYLLTTQKIEESFPRYMNGVAKLPWEEVFKEIKAIMLDDQIKVYSINGESKDALMYKDHQNMPFNVIVIGGDKLSRGLTLEGLTVSYFTRNSNTYDTLMQMGRWFGYRPGYLDLCRLYVPKSLYDGFQHISMATEDLVDQITYMNDLDETPENFGLRIATHPQMLISSPNKIRSGEDRYISFSNTLSQTRSIDIDSQQYKRNFEAVQRLINTLGHPMKNYWESKGRKAGSSKHYFWAPVSGYTVAQFLLDFETSKQANRANSKYMADYLKDQLSFGGATNWTVCLINIDDEDTFPIGGLTVGKGIVRNSDKGGFESHGNVCSIKTMTSNGHEYLDFTQDQMNRVTEITKGNENEQERRNVYIRHMVRERTQGLLIIYPINTDSITPLKIDGCTYNPFGFAIVFPDCQEQGNLISYRLNDVGMRNEDLELY